LRITTLINATIRQVMLYVAINKRLHISSTRCDHCQSCHQTIY